MTALPPLYRDQRKVDQDHLRLLVLFHYIAAALSGVGLLFVFGHYSFLRVMLTLDHPVAARHGGALPKGPSPDEVFRVLIWFYLAFALWFVLSAIGDLISARCIKARRHRTFSLLVAGLNLLHTPVGTCLGIFTFVVLLRDSVRELYDAAAGGPNPPAPATIPSSASTPTAMTENPAPQPPPIPPMPPPVNAAPEQGDATGGIIPYKNPHALVSYYLGIFSCFPILGFFLGIAAIWLGVSGLKQRRARPVIRGQVHAWIGIVCGSCSVALHLLVVGLLVLSALHRHH